MKIFGLFAIVVFLSALLTHEAHCATVVSSSRVSKCVLDGGAGLNSTQLNCGRKMVVTMAVSTTAVATSQISAVIGSTVDDSNAESLTLLAPITIKITMSPIKILYPIYYVQSVNGNPYETVQTHPLLGDKVCEDGAFSNSPSCGWAVDGAGQRLFASQGYCCRCTVSDVFGNSNWRRGSLNCDLFGDQMASSHCLRFGDSWWDTYEVGNSITWYTVNIEVTQGSQRKVISLTPATPIGLTPDRNVSAVIIGNMAPSIALPTFAGLYLTVPTLPTSSSRVRGGMTNWMMVDRTQFDLSGRTCNKIGVSYTAFNAESNRCENPRGNCLQNQLDWIWTQDILRRSAGQSPRNLLQRYGNFLFLPKSMSEGMTSPTPQLGLVDPQLRNVLIQMEINADDLIFINYRSTGKILDVVVVPFAGESPGGRATVTVQNTGLTNADFYVQVENCTDPIQQVPAQKTGIPPYYTQEFEFELYSRAKFSQENQCNVTLYDSEFGFLDAFLVRFNTTDRPYTNGTQGGNGPPLVDGGGSRVNGSTGSCSCGFLDFPCYIFQNCWGQFISILITAAVIIVGIILLCKCGPRLLRCLKPSKVKKGAKKPKTVRVKSSEPSYELEEYSTKSSLTAGRAPSPLSTPQKVKPAHLSLDESSGQIAVIISKPNLPTEKVDESVLREWAEKSRLIYLNVSDMEAAKKFSYFPGENFSIAGALVEFKLPEQDNMPSPWSFELCVGFDHQKWYQEKGSAIPITHPLVDELPRCLDTVLDTKSACLLISKRPRFPCINKELANPM